MYHEIYEIINKALNNSIYLQIIAIIMQFVGPFFFAAIVYISTSKFELAFKTRTQQIKHELVHIIFWITIMLAMIILSSVNNSDKMIFYYSVSAIVSGIIMVASGMIIFFLSTMKKIIKTIGIVFDLALIGVGLFSCMTISAWKWHSYMQQKKYVELSIFILLSILIYSGIWSFIFRKSFRSNYAKVYYMDKKKKKYIYMALNENCVVIGNTKRMNDKHNKKKVITIEKLEDMEFYPIQDDYNDVWKEVQVFKNKIAVKKIYILHLSGIICCFILPIVFHKQMFLNKNYRLSIVCWIGEIILCIVMIKLGEKIKKKFITTENERNREKDSKHILKKVDMVISEIILILQGCLLIIYAQHESVDEISGCIFWLYMGICCKYFFVEGCKEKNTLQSAGKYLGEELVKPILEMLAVLLASKIVFHVNIQGLSQDIQELAELIVFYMIIGLGAIMVFISFFLVELALKDLKIICGKNTSSKE